ncbi:MAG: glycosyltransferase family 4 protein [Thermoanaerobaculia bacterium]
MKILMAVDYYRPNISGLSLYVERLSGALAARGHAVTILTHRHLPDLPEEEWQGEVRVLRRPVLARIGKALVSPALLLAAAREISQSDVFHLHAPLVGAVPLALISQHAGIPLLVTYHCDLRPPEGVVQRAIEALARASQNFALDRAWRTVTYTEDYARHTSSLAERPEAVSWILPPVPDGRAPLSDVEARARYGVSGKPVILFLGRFAEEKGLPYLIEAFPAIRRRFPEARLVLVGERADVPGETVGDRLAPLIDSPDSGMLAIGSVPPEQTGDLLALADLLVLPSTNSTESFGLVQVEAMLRGVPVVASDLPGVRQPILLTGMGEIAPVADSTGLAAAMGRVLESPEKYRRGRDEIRRIFSLDRTVSEYESLYRAAAGG